MKQYKNPIIRGYNPDPSICRVGDDYYLVTSTFEFFPGVPIYHSRDLVNWKLINYCLTRDSQLPLEGCGSSKGIFAPTIRHHNGRFYMITTNVSGGGNFLVYTDDIYSEWSEPKWIDQQGIDPSLFFDDDGRVYYCGTGSDKNGFAIVGFEIDPDTGERLSEKQVISRGAGGKHPEAPHIYKINGTYYLMLAEGGTEYGHMVTMFRSDSPMGPYEPDPKNPILSHKDYISPIQATGHADIVQDTAGQWWMVCLAIRPLGFMHLHNLGRETFLAPMIWDEDGWPIVGDNGHIGLEMEAKLPPEDTNFATKHLSSTFDDRFDGEALDLEWGYVRNPIRENYRLIDGSCELQGVSDSLHELNPTLMIIRQKEFEQRAQTRLLSVDGEGEAGIVAYYNHDYFYSLGIVIEAGSRKLVLTKKVHDVCSVASIFDLTDADKQIDFAVDTGQEKYSFYYRLAGRDWVLAGQGSTAGLCTEGTHTMTFTGTWLGVYAHKAAAKYAYFKIDDLDS